MPSFKDTRVLLSFGSAAGGFEFAMELRRNIMGKYGKKFLDDPYFVYVDAESLRKDKATGYTWDEKLGIYKMSNPFWKEFYLGAMDACQYMVYLISKPWLTSNWCWDEFKWYEHVTTTKSITPIFVVFKDAQEILNGSNKVKDGAGGEHDLKPLWQQMITNKKAWSIDIMTDAPKELGKVVVEGATYTYSYKYVCSETELNTILSKINIKE